jgi:hypothetical protein
MGPVTDAHKLTYQRNVELAVQQINSRFEDAFTFHPELAGRIANILELIGSTSAIIDGVRGGDTPNIDNQLEPVWVVPHQVEWGKLIEKEDAIKALTDYQSPFVQSGAAAVRRDTDRYIYAPSIFGNRKIGQDGNTTSPWDSTNHVVTIGIGSADDLTATGMNVKKFIRAVRLLQQGQVDIDTEDLWATLNAQGIEELYRDITYVNTDYRSKSVLEGRQVREIMDIKIIPYEYMADFDTTTYTAAVWCKSGMHYGTFDSIKTKAEPNPAKKYRIHPYMEQWVGASRSEDAKVIKILNKK